MSQIVQQKSGAPRSADRDDGEFQSTARMALKILSLFSLAEPVLGVSEIGRRLGMHKSKASRLVAALAAENFVVRTDAGRYRLGHQLYALGAIVPREQEFLAATRPELYEIRMATGENVHLTVLSGTELVHLERVYSERVMKRVLNNRTLLPPHATSTGKVLLAYDNNTCEQVISRGLHRYSPRTMTDPDMLRRHLEVIRAQGFAINRDEFQPGLSSVAAPVFGRDGHALGTIAVITASERLNSVRTDHALRVLKEATIRIGQRLT